MSRHHHHRSGPMLGGFFLLAVALGFLFAYPIPTLTVLALVTFFVVMSVRSRRKAAAERVRLGQEGWARYMREKHRPVPGANWCDSCADWTTHETTQHA